ncbi:MMPL family transporter [Chrysiogenes arsenatis]|uniref:MMPL family transporter n=1 Tax=Chrysiogenes arsenatis TaxID=309797 RepID=UPI00042323C3|nr:MMPL family transporter [Chrysiogenes arsenatis]
MTFFGALYAYFEYRKRFLALLFLLGVSMAGYAALQIQPQTNASALVPRSEALDATNFALLAESPLARKIFISLHASERQLLFQAADHVTQTLASSHLTVAMQGGESLFTATLLPYVRNNLPNLLRSSALSAWGASLDEATVAATLQQQYQALLGPAAHSMKSTVRVDPLSLHEIILKSMTSLNVLPNTDIVEGRLLSHDGQHLLLIVSSDVAITDAERGSDVLTTLERALDALPHGVSATVVSPYHHTRANASAIQHDLKFTFTLSLLAMGVIFFVVIRQKQALFTLLTPLVALLAGVAALALLVPTPSAIALGFGAVLIGIAIDSALHVYFALRNNADIPPRQVINAVSRPVLFGSATTLAAFAVLFFSSLPGQQQLALLAVVGILCGTLFSLVILPHLITPPSTTPTPVLPAQSASTGKRRTLLFTVWILSMLLLVPGVLRVNIDGSLQALNYADADIQQAEADFRTVWGNTRDRAMILTDETTSLDTALSLSEQFVLAVPELPLMTLSSLLPSTLLQQENRQAWVMFWQGSKGQEILGWLQRHAREVGFSANAFAPFVQTTQALPPVIDVQQSATHELAELAAPFLLPSDGDWRVLTFAPDTAQLRATFIELSETLPQLTFLSQAQLAEQVGEAIQSDFIRFFASALVMIAVMLLLLFRRVSKALYALLPALSGTVCMFGIMGYVGMACNAMNIVAAALVLGLAVDYGIYMVCQVSEGYAFSVSKAVLASGFTTLAGLGALALAEHPALNSIGITVLLGVSSALVVALVFIPRVYQGRTEQ